MAKALKKSPAEKLRVVLSVLRGELSVAAAGRRAGVSVPVGVARGRREWRDAAQHRPGGLGAEPLGVLAGGDE